MPVPADTSAPLPNMLLPAVLQQRRPLPLPDLAQAGINSAPPTGVEHHGTQVKRRCLESCLEDIWNLHEDDVPHEQPKESGPNAAFCVCACGYTTTHTHTGGRMLSRHACKQEVQYVLQPQVLHSAVADVDVNRRATEAKFARRRA